MRDRAYIIARRYSSEAARLASIATSVDVDVFVAVDEETTEGIWYPDSDLAGFRGISAYNGAADSLTAWERAWYHIYLNHGEFTGSVWLIEDDVAMPRSSWLALHSASSDTDSDFSSWGVRTVTEDPDWYHWGKGAHLFGNPAHSFNPLCRLSSRLIGSVLEFRRWYNGFIFQEILFASLAREHGLSFYDWEQDPEIRGYFPDFRFRPDVAVPFHGICHPVKDASLHEVICGL